MKRCYKRFSVCHCSPAWDNNFKRTFWQMFERVFRLGGISGWKLPKVDFITSWFPRAAENWVKYSGIDESLHFVTMQHNKLVLLALYNDGHRTCKVKNNFFFWISEVFLFDKNFRFSTIIKKNFRKKNVFYFTLFEGEKIQRITNVFW